MPRILLVDDSWLARKTMSKMLQSIGHDVVEAVDGKDALVKMDEVQPDCLLLDLLMPEMDGFQVLEVLQKQETQIPVLVLSADIQDTTRERCMNLGAYGFINKPIKEDALAAVLQKVFP